MTWRSGEVRLEYEGAPHSSFDRRFDEHAGAFADARERVLAFIARRTPSAG